MRTLKEYLKLPSVNELNESCKTTHSKYNKEHYVGNRELRRSMHRYDYMTFEEFVNENNITEITDDTYNFYLDNNISEDAYYEVYQKHLYETLNRSYDSKKLFNEISKYINIKDVEYVNAKKSLTQFNIYVSKDEYMKLRESEEVFHKINLYNYYVKNIVITEDNLVEIHFEPYKPDDLQNYVYDECKGIIYMVMTENVWNKITKSKEITKHILKPNKIENGKVLYRDGRLYAFANNDFKKIKRGLNSIINLNNIQHPVIVKTDLKKYRFKLMFRHDSSSLNLGAVYTEEPIPSYCCERIELDNIK